MEVKDAYGRVIRMGSRVALDRGGKRVINTVAFADPVDQRVYYVGDGWDWAKDLKVLSDETPLGPPEPCASDYHATATAIATLVTEKQAAYGDAFGKAGQVLRILYPDGITHEKMDDALTITRILDKLFRIATDKDAFGESPYRDIAGYCLLAIERSKKP